MTTPRPHAVLAARYFADDTLKCWVRCRDSNDNWSPWYAPSFNEPLLEYYVGHEPPPPIKRTITITVNGLRVWEHTDADKLCQSKLRMHSTETDARAWSDFDQWCRGGGV